MRATGLLALAIAAVMAAGQPVLRVGRATSGPREEFRELDPIARYLAARLGRHGVRSGEVAVASSRRSDELLAMLREGRVDLVWDSPSAILRLRRQAGAVVLAAGGGDFSSIVFSHASGPVRSLRDLGGRVLALEDAGSTTSYLLPLCALEQAGLEAVKDVPGRAPGRGAVTFRLAGSEINVATWVFFDKVAAGALSSRDWENPKRVPARFKQQFRVLHRSEPVPWRLLAARKGLDPALLAEIRGLLLAAHESEEGRAALAPLKVDRLRAPGPETQSTIDRIAAECGRWLHP